MFHRLPFYPKSLLPLIRQRRVIPQVRRRHTQQGTYPLVGHSVIKVSPVRTDAPELVRLCRLEACRNTSHGRSVDKVAKKSSRNRQGIKKDAGLGIIPHPIHFIILFKFKAVAERRQWSSAASKPRRKIRVRLWLHFWMANVPSHQICRSRRACWYSGDSA